jgi:hypothetical protein
METCRMENRRHVEWRHVEWRNTAFSRLCIVLCIMYHVLFDKENLKYLEILSESSLIFCHFDSHQYSRSPKGLDVDSMHDIVFLGRDDVQIKI